MNEDTRRIVFDYIALFIAIGGAIFGVYHFFKNPQVVQASDIRLLESRVDYIEGDGMLHIQNNITELKSSMKDVQKKQVTQGENIAKILGILTNRKQANAN